MHHKWHILHRQSTTENNLQYRSSFFLLFLEFGFGFGIGFGIWDWGLLYYGMDGVEHLLAFCLLVVSLFLPLCLLLKRLITFICPYVIVFATNSSFIPRRNYCWGMHVFLKNNHRCPTFVPVDY